MRRDAPEPIGVDKTKETGPEGFNPVRKGSDIAGDLNEAARLIESSAIALAGEVAGGKVTHLMLMSQQLERISRSLKK